LILKAKNYILHIKENIKTMTSYYGQLIIGPAGSGKSTYCKLIQDNAADLKRNVLVINLDPAAEIFKYRCDIDVRD
jgi:polynucleotide 5'-kinase involved in rRNA processing